MPDFALGIAHREGLDTLPLHRPARSACYAVLVSRDGHSLDFSSAVVLGPKVRAYQPRLQGSPTDGSCSGFLTLHSLTMLMKVHSYLAMNGAMSEKRILLQKSKKQLDEAVEKQGGWSKVLYQASRETTNGASAAKVPANGHLGVSSAIGKDELSPTTGSFDSALSRRRRSSNRSNPLERTDLLTDPKDPRRLIDYSDEAIYNLANDCIDLQEDLTSTGKSAITWPANVTYANYIDYLLVPSLVYELEYPRTNSIRPLYVLEKTLATFGTFFVIYAITEHVIFPSHEASKANPIRADSFIGAALDLILPFMLNYLLIFYIIFECICNAFAELTCFADRGFYEDWWNAVTWDEFARKWNKPVHQVGAMRQCADRLRKRLTPPRSSYYATSMLQQYKHSVSASFKPRSLHFCSVHAYTNSLW